MVAKLLLVVSGLLMLFFVRPKLPKFVLYHTKIAHCQVRAAKVELRVVPELPKFLHVSRGAKVALGLPSCSVGLELLKLIFIRQKLPKFVIAAFCQDSVAKASLCQTIAVKAAILQAIAVEVARIPSYLSS